MNDNVIHVKISDGQQVIIEENYPYVISEVDPVRTDTIRVSYLDPSDYFLFEANEFLGESSVDE